MVSSHPLHFLKFKFFFAARGQSKITVCTGLHLKKNNGKNNGKIGVCVPAIPFFWHLLANLHFGKGENK